MSTASEIETKATEAKTSAEKMKEEMTARIESDKAFLESVNVAISSLAENALEQGTDSAAEKIASLTA